MIRILLQIIRRCNQVSSASIFSYWPFIIVNTLIISIHSPNVIQAQQNNNNFLSFIQPFIDAATGGGGQHQQQIPFLQRRAQQGQQQAALPPSSPAAAPPPSQSQQQQQPPPLFGGIGQFVDLFRNMRQQNPREESAQQVTNMAQNILSTFSNSQGPAESRGGGGIGEYLSLGRNFGLGSALQDNAASRRRRRQSAAAALSRHQPAPLPNIFTLFEGIGKKAAERRSRQRAPPISRQSRPVQSNSPIIKLTDSFGRNFFQMLDELYAYSNMPGVQGPSAGAAPAPAPASAAPLSQLFPWLPSLPPASPSLSPSFPPAAAPPAAVFDDTQRPSEVAKDMIDANQLMRAFLKTMSRDASKPLKPMPVLRDGTEAGQNRPLMDQLFESDILLTSRQMKAIVLAEAERKNGRLKRKVITGAAYRWPKGQPVVYTFREPDKKWRQIIQTGLKLWETETCVRFREGGFAKDRIEFIRGSGCYSSVGRVGGNQKVSIGHGCEDKGIVTHEVGHSLGFWHEQSRPDREQYIRLDERYIMGGTEGNFAKRSDLEIDGMGLPYDLGSVMHYGPNAFTTDWDHITIVTADRKYQHSIGQRKGPSFIDVKQINRLYCHHSCKGTPVSCHNGGYADPNNCLRCKCPPGLGGPNCANVENDGDILCGGELHATGVWQHLTHKSKKRCTWRIRGEGNSRVRFILDSVDYPCETTCHSFVEFKHNSDFQQIGFRACCDEKNVEVLSDQSEMLVLSDPGSRDGSFTLRYIADPGSGVPLPKPPPPAWVPGRENRPFRGVTNKGGVIEKFILNAIPRVRDPSKPLESVASILTDYFASSILGVSRRR